MRMPTFGFSDPLGGRLRGVLTIWPILNFVQFGCICSLYVSSSLGVLAGFAFAISC